MIPLPNRAAVQVSGRHMNPKICFSSLLVILVLSLVPARYGISPALASNSPYIESHASEIAILEQAQSLFHEYGSRPPYKGPAFPQNARLSPDEAKMVLPYILACESGARNVSEIDSNHKWSRGPAQFQDATWNARQTESGIEGKPTEAIPAVEMSLWSLENGYISQWTCSKIERIIR